MEKIKSGNTNNVWKVDLGSRQFQGDYSFLNEVESYARFSLDVTEDDVNGELEYNIPWDCFCGLGVFGFSKDVLPVFKQLKSLMVSSVDEENYEEDLLDETNPTRLSLYSVPDSDFMIVMGAGYYVESTLNCQSILTSAKNVYALESGANYGSGDCDPLEDIIVSSKEDESFPKEFMPLITYLKNHCCYDDSDEEGEE